MRSARRVAYGDDKDEVVHIELAVELEACEELGGSGLID